MGFYFWRNIVRICFVFVFDDWIEMGLFYFLDVDFYGIRHCDYYYVMGIVHFGKNAFEIFKVLTNGNK